MSVPIIFLHHGESYYLGMSITCASKTNDNVVLLGDSDNEYLAYNINFAPFYQYDKSEYIQKFNKVFQPVTSLRNTFFIYFDFLRWIRIYYYMKNNNIDACFYFDSDTLITTNLQKYLHRFTQDFAIVNYFSGCACYINGLSSLEKYIELMLKLFQDAEFLNMHRQYIEKLALVGKKHSFCDMQVFNEYQKRISTLYELTNIYYGSSFDANISLDRADQLVSYPEWEMEAGHKKIVWNFHKPYCFNIEEKKLIRMNTLNMSWVAPDFFREVYSELMKTF